MDMVVRLIGMTAFAVGLLLVPAGATAPAQAQATSQHCLRPAKPAFPDPKTVSPENAERLDQAMQKYSGGTTAYVQCLSGEAARAQKEGADTINLYNQRFLAEYNKRAAAQ